MAPCGGERPTGSSSRTRSRSVCESNRRTSAGTRIANGVFRAGPVTTTVATAERPDLRPEHAAIERLESHAPPPPTDEEQSERTGWKAYLRRQSAATAATTTTSDGRSQALARIRERRSRRRRRGRGVGRAALDDARDHGETRSRSCFDPRRTDARNRVQILDRAEATVGGAVVDDLLGRDRPDARKASRLLDRGRAQARTNRRRLPDTAGDAAPARGPASRRRAALRD